MRIALAAVVVVAAACGDNLPGPADGHLFEGKVWGGNLAVADGWVYFTTYGERDGKQHALWRVSRDGGAAEPIWVGPRGIFGYGLAIGEGHLFWSEAVDEQLTAAGVFEVSASGGNETQLATFSTMNAPYAGVSFDAGHVYAANEDEVLDIPAGGTASTAYAGSVSWMVHRGGHLYVLAGNMLLADGAPIAMIGSPEGQFDVDDHAAYIGDGESLRRIPLDATTTAAAIDIHGKPQVITAGPHEVYAVVQLVGGEELDRFDFASGATTALADDLHVVGALAADDTSVYLAECCDNGVIARFDL
jgi:hypothetical protein